MPLLNWMSEHSLLSILLCILLIISMAFLAPLFRSKKIITKPPERTLFPYNYQFPDIVLSRWKAKYPHLNDVDFSIAQKSLLQFFEVLYHNKTSVAMVSQIADELWHEFILHTKAYCEFCEKTFGKYIHHNPTESNVEYDWSQQKIPVEMMNLYKFLLNSPLNITKNIPLIFTVDSLLKIDDGYTFNLTKIEEQYQEQIQAEEQKKKEDDEKKAKSSCGGGGCSGGGCGGD